MRTRAGPRSRTPLSWIALCALAAGCGDGSPAGAPAPGEPASEAARDRAGHERMLALLREVAARTPSENSYLGDAPLRAQREALARLPADAPAVQRARQCFLVGAWELRAGNFEAAIERFERCEALLAGAPAGGRPAFAADLDYVLGVAHLRLGETRNCVARHTARSCILPIAEEGVHVDQEGARNAIAYFERVLAERPEGDRQHLAARWLLNIAYMTVGEHPDGVPPAYLIPPEAYASKVAFPRFHDVAPELGLNTFNLCGGSLIDDFDGDGALDLLNSTWDPEGPLRLFRSAGDGTFTERTAEAGLEGVTGGLNLVHADYDGDGDLDVLVLRGAWLVGPPGQVPNSLLRNDGDGRFTDVTFRAGLGAAHYPTQTAAFADYDNDGDLDLYVGNEAVPQFPFPSQLFRNEGDGTFVDVAARAGVENLAYAKGVSWGDYDGDRYPDLFVSNLGSENRLYHNQRDGTFVDVARAAGVARPLESFPAWFWDFDNDGALDLYVSSYPSDQELGRLAPVVASALGLPHDAETARLYRGDGRGGFEDVTAAQGLERVSLPMGANFGDLDNDGFLDFYLGTGYPFFDGLTPNVMYWNRGGAGFADVTTAGGFGHLQKGHGVSFADLDDDGDQDVFEQMGGAFRGDGFGNVLYENPGFGNHWLKLELSGVRSNRSALGARIRLELQDGAARRTVHRHVSTGGSFGGNPFMQHLGIGGAERVARLEVYWPTSDTTQVFEDVAADRRLRIVEGRDTLEELERRPFRFRR